MPNKRHKFHKKCAKKSQWGICIEGFIRLFEHDDRNEYDGLVKILFNGRCKIDPSTHECSNGEFLSFAGYGKFKEHE